MVDAPPVMVRERKLLSAVRTMASGSKPGLVQKFLSSMATVAWLITGATSVRWT